MNDLAKINPVALAGLAPAQIVEMLTKIVAAMPQCQLPLTHEFEAGIYRRTMRAPSQCVIVGDVHALPSVTRLVSGKIIIWDAANGTQVLTGPCQTQSAAGVQRIGFTQTEIVWQEEFATKETDLDKLETLLRRRKEIA